MPLHLAAEELRLPPARAKPKSSPFEAILHVPRKKEQGYNPPHKGGIGCGSTFMRLDEHLKAIGALRRKTGISCCGCCRNVRYYGLMSSRPRPALGRVNISSEAWGRKERQEPLHWPWVGALWFILPFLRVQNCFSSYHDTYCTYGT